MDGYRPASPRVEELCRIETFQQGFNSKDFLAGLSEKLIARSKADPGPFNPRPFIRTFESSVDSLLSLRSQLTTQITSLSSSVRVSESAYTSKLHDLSSHFASASASFGSLENRFSEVGRTAMHIGDQLQTIDRMRTRAAEAHDLIEYYYQFARGDTSRLERLRKEGGREGRLRTAVIARRLGAIAREVDIPGAAQTRDTIDKFAERFERDMLKLFDRFYRKSDPKMMSHIAKVLQSFNGGVSCVQIYVNQHDFFISKDRVMQRRDLEQSAMWSTIADPDALPPKSEPSLQALFGEIRSTVEVEAQIISAVFPSPLGVMTSFLQRVFAQSVQGYVEVLMEKATEVGSAAAAGGTNGSGEGHLAFLRTLQMARSMSLNLVNDLKVYDFRGAGIITSGKNDSLGPDGRHMNGDGSVLGSGANAGVNGSGSGGGASAGGSSLGIVLDQAVEELFVPYMDGLKYLERESRSLTELYATFLLHFSNYHRGAFGFGKLSNLVDRARVAAGGTASSSSVAPSDASTLVEGRTSNDDSLTAMSGGASSIEQHDGALSLDVAERMLRWHAEAIGRCVDLSSSSDMVKNAFALLKVLAEAYVKSYTECAIDSALTHASAQDPRASVLPDLRDLMVVRQAELVMQLWQHYVNTALLPLATSSVTIRREMSIYNNHLLLRVERKCDSIVQKVTDNIVGYLSGRLSTQKKNDFTPKNDELAFSRINTDPCLAIVDALEKVDYGAKNYLGPGKNCEAFLTEIGVAFHGLLLDHLRKYVISGSGGIILTKDLAMYQDSINAFGVSALADRFEMLRQLGNLFIVQPGVLKSYMRESHLSKVEERYLRPYLLKRADYATHVRDLSDFDDRSTGPAGNTGQSGESSSFNKINVGIGEME
ncbi:exocyst complex component Sec10 [Meira miltonrushii]|uniref:Exocyst complex component Sec10 n=1 Tax=Meira miltonrushii TaxID=1280837 RepID=A0A316V8U9_9BASI|nr:exocyst complex component Sec10 [Meira miltonrushii]PWN33920.1 exocyst complex component Sec10 [Meira miltonrushii]